MRETGNDGCVAKGSSSPGVQGSSYLLSRSSGVKDEGTGGDEGMRKDRQAASSGVQESRSSGVKDEGNGQ